MAGAPGSIASSLSSSSESDDDHDDASSFSGTVSSCSSTAASPPLGGAVATAPDAAMDAHFHAHVKRDPYLLVHKGVYALGMGSGSAYFPFFTLYTTRVLGFTFVDSGYVYALGHVAALFAAPLLTRLADTSATHRRCVLVGGMLAQAALILGMSQARSFAAVAAFEMAQESAAAATWPIMDAATCRVLEVTRGSTAAYGQTRAFGALGWGVMAWGFGALYDDPRVGIGAMFLAFALSALPAAALASRVPLEARPARPASSAAAYARLMRWDVALVFAVVFIAAVLLQIVDVWRGPYLKSLGASNQLLGISITVTACSEFPMFFVTSWLLERITLPAALLSVLCMYAVRFTWYAYLVNPWWTMVAELMHGVTFAIGWASATQYIALLLPPELASTGQGLLAALQWGIAASVGAVAGGAIAGAWGWRVMWLSGAAFAVCGIALMGGAMCRSGEGCLASAPPHRAVLEEGEGEGGAGAAEKGGAGVAALRGSAEEGDGKLGAPRERAAGSSSDCIVAGTPGGGSEGRGEEPAAGAANSEEGPLLAAAPVDAQKG